MPKTTTLIFRNASVSGRDYRAKGVHILVPGHGEVSKPVPTEMVEKIKANFRKSAPYITIEEVKAPASKKASSPKPSAKKKEPKKKEPKAKDEQPSTADSQPSKKDVDAPVSEAAKTSVKEVKE